MRRWLLCHARLSGFGCEKARAEKRSWFVLLNKKKTMHIFLLDGMIRFIALLLELERERERVARRERIERGQVGYGMAARRPPLLGRAYLYYIQ